MDKKKKLGIAGMILAALIIVALIVAGVVPLLVAYWVWNFLLPITFWQKLVSLILLSIFVLMCWGSEVAVLLAWAD